MGVVILEFLIFLDPPGWDSNPNIENFNDLNSPEEYDIMIFIA